MIPNPDLRIRGEAPTLGQMLVEASDTEKALMDLYAMGIVFCEKYGVSVAAIRINHPHSTWSAIIFDGKTWGSLQLGTIAGASIERWNPYSPYLKFDSMTGAVSGEVFVSISGTQLYLIGDEEVLRLPGTVASVDIPRGQVLIPALDTLDYADVEGAVIERAYQEQSHEEREQGFMAVREDS